MMMTQDVRTPGERGMTDCVPQAAAAVVHSTMETTMIMTGERTTSDGSKTVAVRTDSIITTRTTDEEGRATRSVSTAAVVATICPVTAAIISEENQVCIIAAQTAVAPFLMVMIGIRGLEGESSTIRGMQRAQAVVMPEIGRNRSLL